jgi:hypothetical protein
MEDERRKFKRRYLMFYSRIFDEKTGNMLGHVMDLTPKGLMVLSEKQIEVEKDWRLVMELPPDMAKKPQLAFRGRSLWCRRDINPEFYDTGFQLENISSEDVAIIERMVEDYGLRDR